MITYENALMELNIPGSIGYREKRRLAELLKTLHEENLMLEDKAAQDGEGGQDA
ncbi:hypothetical protein [Oscillibacter sp.]|uniref:hypothetical protein n=1 Tax=Oscillibacter sp. TaxID=1945593 RepID=UPI002896CADE|nr:hypothetical protein [Oscillibacter sp.]